MKLRSPAFLLLLPALLPAQNLPTVKWKFKTSDAIVTSPIIDNGIVYCSSLDKNLYAISLENGKQLWKFTTGGANRSAPTVNGHNVYFLGGDGILYCLDKNTGKEVWKFATGGEKKYDLYGFADHFQSTPVWDNNIIYFGSGDGNIYAINAQNGSLAWKFATGNVVHTTPAINGDKVMVGSFDGYFYALNKVSGNLVWKFKSIGQRYFPRGEFQGSPAVSGKTVYVGSRDFNFYALDADKGTPNWNRYFSYGWSVSTPVFYKNYVVNGTMDDRLLVAMDTSNGMVAWRAALKFDMFGSCLIADSTGYVGTLNGNLFSVNLNNGNILWAFPTDSNKQNHDQYFTKDEQFNDASLTLLNKDLAGQVPIFYKVGGIFSKPARKDNLLVFTSSEGTVYCLTLF